MNHEDFKRKMVKAVVAIVDRGKADKIVEVYKRNHIHFHFKFYGTGTANSEILDVLGLGATDKEILISMVPNHLVDTLIDEISNKMQLKKPGKGIIFTLPLSGVSSIVSNLLCQEVKLQLEKELEKIKTSAQYDLIITVVNQGYTDELFEAAKSAGATGGTIIFARGIGFEEAEKFLGISLHSEKEIVAILAKREMKHDIMAAIRDSSGMVTEARGVVFSIPVEQMEGLQ